jgi:hypothetical protein
MLGDLVVELDNDIDGDSQNEFNISVNNETLNKLSYSINQ